MLEAPASLAPPPSSNELASARLDTREIVQRAAAMSPFERLPRGSRDRVREACARLHAKGKSANSVRAWVRELAAVPGFGPAAVRAAKNCLLEAVAAQRKV